MSGIDIYHFQVEGFFNTFIYLFGCVGSSLLRAGFLQLQQAGATPRHGAQASRCDSFSCCGARALGVWASAVVARGLTSCGSWALECRLSSCGAWAWLLHGMWDLPGPGIEPVSPALAGGFLTTVTPGKSQVEALREHLKCYLSFLPHHWQLPSQWLLCQLGSQSQPVMQHGQEINPCYFKQLELLEFFYYQPLLTYIGTNVHMGKLVLKIVPLFYSNL